MNFNISKLLQWQIFFSLSPVTFPKVFAKDNKARFSLTCKVG